jgi:ABC-type Fe3+-siderophore transport system permease subunit
MDIRLPRTAAALLAGGLLGLAGAVAQGVFRNPLADPYLLGSASGASLGWRWPWLPWVSRLSLWPAWPAGA